MLDNMAESDLTSYKSFIQKNVSEGFSKIKAEKDEKRSLLMIEPKIGFSLTMYANLRSIEVETTKLQESLNFLAKKEEKVDADKFEKKVRIYLNICHHERY